MVSHVGDNQSVVEYYHRHQEEIDLLLDEQRLFLLALIERLEPSTIGELTNHLRLDAWYLACVCGKLGADGMLDLVYSQDSITSIRLSPRGREFLRVLGSPGAASNGTDCKEGGEGTDAKNVAGLRSLTEKTSAIAKELRDVLTSLAINANVAIQRAHPQDAESRELTENVEQAINRALDLTERLFKVTSPETAGRAAIDSITTPALRESVERYARSGRGSEAILVVEDDEAVLTLLTRVLTGKGYRVTAASNGREALETVLSSEGDSIELVLTDLEMPAIDGQSLYERLHSVRPGIKFLFISGYPDGSKQWDFIRAKGLDYIVKPFNADMVADRTRKVLDGIRTLTGGRPR